MFWLCYDYYELKFKGDLHYYFNIPPTYYYFSFFFEIQPYKCTI